MGTLLPAPEEGQLRAYPLPRLLLALCQSRHNGVLNLSQGRKRKRLLFHEGGPVSCESSAASDSLGAYLAESGGISRLDYSKLQSRVAKRGCSEGVALLALKLIDTRGLFDALRDHVRRNLIDAFGWPDGEFRVGRDEQAAKELQPLRSDPYGLVQAGLERHWSPDRILRDLSEHMNEYALPGPAFAKVAARLKKDETVEGLLAALDGNESFGRVVGAYLASTRALAAAWVMSSAGLLRFQDVPGGAIGDEAEREAPQIEIKVAAAPSAPQARAATTPRAAIDPDHAARAAEMREEVLRTLSQLEDLNHYELLGVETDAKIADVKKAYFAAAKRYHPDTLNRLGLGEIKQEASQVFTRIAQAYEALGDARKRRDYDASLRDDAPEIDTQLLARAETLFRKGEVLAKMGDFRRALEYLAPAVELWPAEAEYQGVLGWAYFKKNPPEAEKARSHLEEAVRQAPQNAVNLLRLGIVLGALGEEQPAAQATARARSIDPNVAA